MPKDLSLAGANAASAPDSFHPANLPPSDIAAVLQMIVSSLMPVCQKESNPELWLIYDYMQTWTFQVARALPFKAGKAPDRVAVLIAERLPHLRDRTLADAIARVLKRYSPHVFQPTSAVH